MKSIEQQTREAAENHCNRFDDLSQEERKSCIGDFISGANWEHQRDKWISVKDELPKNGEYVFVFSSVGFSFKGRFMGNEWKVFFSDGENFCDKDLHNITHWQPLPEPPKQKS